MERRRLTTGLIVKLPKRGYLAQSDNWRLIILVVRIAKIIGKHFHHKNSRGIQQTVERTTGRFQEGKGYRYTYAEIS